MEPYAFFKGQYMPLKDAKIGILTQALHYGTATFGGIRANWDEENRAFCLFRVMDHYHRQLNACKILNISLPYDEKKMADITVEVVKRSRIQGERVLQAPGLQVIRGHRREAARPGGRLVRLATNWALTSAPAGSSAALHRGGGSATPRFRPMAR